MKSQMSILFKVGNILVHNLYVFFFMLEKSQTLNQSKNKVLALKCIEDNGLIDNLVHDLHEST
jgi:hypothetical protein